MPRTPDFKYNRSLTDIIADERKPAVLPETGWNKVGISEDLGMAFGSGVTNSGGTNAPVAFYQSEDGEVRMRGKARVPSEDVVITTLPAEARSEYAETFVVAIDYDNGQRGAGLVDVLQNGEIRFWGDIFVPGTNVGSGSTPGAHKNTHVSGGSDAFTSTDLLEASVKRIRESSGPTTLTVGNVSDGEFLKRVGSTIVGSLATISGATAVATDTIWDAAGDLAVGTGADTAARFAVGATNGTVLMTDLGEPLKMRWAIPTVGLPIGGSSSMALVKASDDDFDVTWAFVSGGSGGGVDFEIINAGDWFYMITDAAGGPNSVGINLVSNQGIRLDTDSSSIEFHAEDGSGTVEAYALGFFWYTTDDSLAVLMSEAQVDFYIDGSSSSTLPDSFNIYTGGDNAYTISTTTVDYYLSDTVNPNLPFSFSINTQEGGPLVVGIYADHTVSFYDWNGDPIFDLFGNDTQGDIALHARQTGDLNLISDNDLNITNKGEVQWDAGDLTISDFGQVIFNFEGYNDGGMNWIVYTGGDAGDGGDMGFYTSGGDVYWYMDEFSPGTNAGSFTIYNAGWIQLNDDYGAYLYIGNYVTLSSDSGALLDLTDGIDIQTVENIVMTLPAGKKFIIQDESANVIQEWTG